MVRLDDGAGAARRTAAGRRLVRRPPSSPPRTGTGPGSYRDEVVRQDFRERLGSMEDYLAELGVRVELPRSPPSQSAAGLPAHPAHQPVQPDHPAAAAGGRERAADDPARSVLAVRAGDRFGDNGLVGRVPRAREGDVLHIDNFLLSCRVFARGIEQACLAAVLRHARDAGSAVVGDYRRTAKNGNVADLYPRNGFRHRRATTARTTTFRHDLLDIPAVPEHIRLTDRIGVDAA